MPEEQTRKGKTVTQRIAERRKRIRRRVTMFVAEERRSGRDRRQETDRRAIGRFMRPR